MVEVDMDRKRENWSTRIGVVLAVAGSAVGLGNFLRFPVQAVQNGGGAFMIPYFIAFLLLGIPLCWVEWTMGRYGGRFSHGSAPGIFQVMWKSPVAKYIGAIGLLGPLIIFFYYCYIESWTLGYAYFSAKGTLTSLTSADELSGFLQNYQGVAEGSSIKTAYIFFLITFVANFGIIYFGITRGIERVTKIAMPILAILGVLLAIRILTLGTPDPVHPDWNVNNALGFMWNPDLTRLKDARVWLAAAGQIFFTLSVGIGVILTYASYLKRNDDVALSSLSSASTNGFMEVIIGGSVVIVAAAVFFGAHTATQLAGGGSFNLGFITMPLIFSRIPGGQYFCLMWFLLLFFAGITSSISILQPTIAFLEDEFNLSRRKSIGFMGIFTFIMAQFPIFGIKKGILDEMDFWGGTFLLVVFGFIELIIFAWIFGMDKGWKELNHGAYIKIPLVFKFIIKYVTPLYLFIILVVWFKQQFLSIILMSGDTYKENKAEILMLRLILIIILLFIMFLIKIAWQRYRNPTYSVESR